MIFTCDNGIMCKRNSLSYKQDNTTNYAVMVDTKEVILPTARRRKGIPPTFTAGKMNSTSCLVDEVVHIGSKPRTSSIQGREDDESIAAKFVTSI